MGLFTPNTSDFPWINLDSKEQLNDILNSKNKVLIFKHSTRCGTSSMALKQFVREFQPNPKIETYFLDLIRYREISNLIAEKTGVEHQSPQVIVLEDNKVIYKASHYEIDAVTINKI